MEMKGIYLTQSAKSEIEAKVIELEKHTENVIKIARIASNDTHIKKTYLEVEFKSKISVYKEILLDAIILPEKHT